MGEVRGIEALDMLKAWNTGHPGGIATLHANSALAALYRLEQLVEEARGMVAGIDQHCLGGMRSNRLARRCKAARLENFKISNAEHKATNKPTRRGIIIN